METKRLYREFDRQVQNLIDKNYPKMLGLSSDNFRQNLNNLKQSLANRVLPEIDIENGLLPFVIVVNEDVVDVETMLSMVSLHGKNGIEKLFPLKPTDFHTIDSVEIPPSKYYLMLDVDRGKSSLNIRPKDAMEMIMAQDRSPLTIAEGVALVTHYPDFLMKNNCFSLLASRHADDQRVPAIWISEKRPKLGWCWNGNPHTWLGSASCKERASEI